MRNINEKYKESLKLKNCDDDYLDKLLTQANNIRNFEIEIYCQRSNYFILFIGTLFVGYYRTDAGLFIKMMINSLGILISFIWYLANRGGKFWEENWVLHCEFLEGDMDTLHKTILRKKEKNMFSLLTAYPFSVAKCNILISIIVTFGWITLFIYNIMTCCNLSFNCIYVMFFINILMVILGIFAYIIYIVKSEPNKGKNVCIEKSLLQNNNSQTE